MKSFIYHSFSLLLIFFMNTKNMKAESAKDTTVVIQTSAECEMCEKRIEKALIFEKGIKEVKVDVESGKVIVRYNPSRITLDKIRQLLSKAGYDADDVKADEKAFNKLPECCKKEMKDHPRNP
jgi:periplasmic mercuric ion binding protein